METKKIYLAVLLYSASVGMVFPQIVKSDSLSPWKTRFLFALNFNQASFTTNWKGGGVNSVGLNGQANYKANYRKGKTSWDNEIDFLYGFVSNEGQGFRKTVDRIFIDTKAGHSLSKK